MEPIQAHLPLWRLAVGLVGLFLGVSLGVGLGILLSWSPSDWRYILYNVFMLSAVVLYILWPAMRARRPNGVRRRT